MLLAIVLSFNAIFLCMVATLRKEIKFAAVVINTFLFLILEPTAHPALVFVPFQFTYFSQLNLF